MDRIAQRGHRAEQLARPAHPHEHLVALRRHLGELHPTLYKHIKDARRIAFMEEESAIFHAAQPPGPNSYGAPPPPPPGTPPPPPPH